MSASTKRFRPMLENLEDRAVPAVALVNGDLVIHGTNANDVVSVNLQTINNVPFYRVTQNNVNFFFNAANVWGGDVYFYGYGGNDHFTNNTCLRTTAFGGDGDDVLIGGCGNDYLNGGNGNDYLFGRYGNDKLAGEAGQDTMYGGDGNDILNGGTGRDRLFGEAGNDTLDGGDDGAVDYLNGGLGVDCFQRDWAWTGWFWVNRDAPADFAAGDMYYG